MATHRARPPNSRALNSCPLCPRKFTNALVLQHHIRLHLGGQIPPDEEIPHEDGAETESATFEEGENESISSLSKTQQILPLALTTGPKSPADSLNSGSTFKQPSANDVDSVKVEESEGSSPSLSPPLTSNPPSVGAENLLRLGENAPADGSPVNASGYSEVETHAEPGSSSPFKAPSASSHSVVDNRDFEADDVPLPRCLSKPGVENHNPPNDETCSTNERLASPSSNPNPPAANPIPALSTPTSPKAIPDADDTCGPHDSGGRDAGHSKGKSETTRKSLLVSEPELEKDTPTKEDCDMSEKPSEEPEPCVKAPAPHTQPPRPDKPYSCSHCGKAYASRSGLKVRLKDSEDLTM